MAKDMLDAVYEAEQQCARRESDAKAAAAEKMQRAKEDAANLIEAARKKALEDAELLYEKARSDGKSELNGAVSSAGSRCDALARTAEKNRGRVIELAVKELTE